MSPTRGTAVGSSSASKRASGRRSTSLEQRRQSTSGYKDGMQDGVGQSVTPPIGTVAPPPKERLPPSPPLTPVASLDNLRGASAKKEGKESNATSKSGTSASEETSGRVALDKRDTATADGSGAGDERDTKDDVDTEADGALSAYSYRTDGFTEASTTHAGTSADGGDDGIASAAASAVSLAQPSSVVAAPGNIPQEPTPPQEYRDPLSRANGDVNAEASSGSSYSEQPPPDTSSSPMPPGHEQSSSSPFPFYSNPLHAGPSPQPWDLVDPPSTNNTQMEERMRRVRKESNRSVARSLANVNVVVKDGKKYRIPHSSYYFSPPPDTSAFGTDPIGHIGVHHPREIVRIERDYSGGELAQFSPAYPLELEGRITPTQFLETINAINETLLEAHSLRWSFLDNTLAVLTLYISRLFIASHYERKMKQLRELIDGLNKDLYNPVGLNVLWPKDVAFMFLEIEYY